VVGRTGGSAGPTSINRDLFYFLHLPGSLPRKTHGSVIIQTERKSFIYYCTPYEVDRTVLKCVNYWQPHRDDICRTFKSAFIEKHSGLRPFAAICDFLRREDELMTELMNHKRSTLY
jgi:hypothetical protein